MITITLNEYQAAKLSWACEMLSRLMMNQFDTLNEICYRKDVGFPDYTEIEDVTRQLKDMYSPDLVERQGYSGSWGILCPEVPNHARTLWDMNQCIRYALAWGHNLMGGSTVDFSQPFRTDSENPLVDVRHDDSILEIYVSFFRRMNPSIRRMIDKRGWKVDTPEYNEWIEQCKQFALYEYEHVKRTQTPLPGDEYLDFFNEKLTDDGKYVVWRDDD